MKEKKRVLLVTLAVLFVACALVVTLVLLDKSNGRNKTDTTKATETTQTTVPITEKVEKFESVIDTSKPETYATLLDVLSTLSSKYSSINRLNLGYSTTGKAIPMVTIGTGEKKALVVGALHAREHLATKYLLRCIEDYCYAYEYGNGTFGQYDLKKLFSEYTVFIVPCANPDGLDIVLSQMKPSSKVIVEDLEDYKSNYNGVDLNRNFPLEWDKIDNGVYQPYAYFFKGYQSASEKETQAIMALCDEHKFDFMLSIHVKGNFSFWGDLHDTSRNATYKAFASDIGDASGLLPLPQPTQSVKDYSGGFENWFRHTYKKPGLCVELVDVENTIKPCGSENYEDFDNFVIYDRTRYIIGAALASKNK